MSVKLIILADLGCLKAYRVTKDEIADSQRIELIEESSAPGGHDRISEGVTDQAGRFPTGNAVAGGQMSHGENHNLALEIQSRSIRQIAEDIGRIVSAENPGSWYFAANNEIDGKILDQLDEPVRRKLGRRVRSNLTKTDKNELLSHFKRPHF